jgi:hypothetical protein
MLEESTRRDEIGQINLRLFSNNKFDLLRVLDPLVALGYRYVPTSLGNDRCLTLRATVARSGGLLAYSYCYGCGSPKHLAVIESRSSNY